MATLHAVIMAGGSGTRFWPASRQSRPKQVLPLANGKPLIQSAVERLAGVCSPEHIWIVTNARQKRVIARLLLDFPVEQILVEPEARDTAPCIAFATATIAARDPDAMLAVLPADHVIEPVDQFERMIRRAVGLADDGQTLVTFGIPPNHPATGYGYIELGSAHDEHSPPARMVRSFREKPDAVTAKQFVDSGQFWWNSGIIVFSISAMRAAMATTEPTLAEATDRMLAAIQAQRRAQVVRAFKQAPKTSIDYAVMEKAKHLLVVEATAQWDDVGSFPALAAIAAADAHGNHAVLHRGASTTSLDSRDNIVYAEGRRTVALFGVDNLVVAAVGDAVLVCPKEKSTELKALVEHLRAEGRNDLL